eukprot:2655486-Prymnesium_polylepis.1
MSEYDHVSACMTPTRSEWMSRIHTSVRTVSRLFHAISRAVSRYFAGCFALFREFRGWGCTRFAAVSRVFRV